MLKKGSKLYSILTGTCPKCQNESMYVHKNPYNLSKVFEMHERCSHCNLKYKIEPSFFFGAMYVSYGVGIAFGVAAFIISYFFIGTNLKVAFISIIAALVLFMPFIMRISRNIWINMFIHYDKNALKK
jgi:VIT1/CCC1 family predicted Fe2+/Mn2+ transporter